MANITGTLISDLIIPNAIIQGEILPDLLGDDIIEALDGDDAVAGSSGNDSIVGGSGDDQLFGNSGKDTIEGNSGNDSIAAGRDSDRIFGGEGNDLIFGNMGEDNLRGGDGNDTIYGGKDNDILQGEAGDDVLIGDFGADTMNGGGGDDVFVLGRRPNNPNGASTGGLSADAADVIQDFRQQGNDTIALEGGLTFADLEFTDDANGDAVIRDANGTGEVLATVKGKTAAELQANPAWFQPVGGGGGGNATAVADLEVTKTVSDQSPLTPYNPGDTIQYVVTVNNTGPETATNVQLNDLLPAGVTFVSSTQNGMYNSATGIWSFDSLPSGGSAQLFIDATIDAGATGTIVNTAAGLTATQADPDPTDNTASISFVIGGGVADAIAPDAPKLIDGESIVANQTGVLGRVGASDNVGVTGFSIMGATHNGLNPVVNAVTIDATGQLTLTAVGATLLTTTGNYLDVQLTAQDAAGNVSAAGTIRIFADVNTAVNSPTLSKVGDGTDESFNTAAADTVLVASGLYGGSTLTKTVKLLGANKGIVPGTIARPTPESQINSPLTVATGVENVIVDGFQFSGTGGIDLDGGNNNTSIENNLFDGANLAGGGARAIHAPAAALPTNNLSIQNNRIQNTPTGAPAILLNNLAGGTVANNTFDRIGNPAAVAAADDGILVDAVTGLTISGNQFTNVSGSGIEVGATSTNLTIQGNTIDRVNGVHAPAPVMGEVTDGGITVNAGAHTNLSITGNRVTNAGNGSLTVVGGPGNPVTATGNVFDDFGAVGAADLSIFNTVAGQSVFSVGNSLASGVPLGAANIGGGGGAGIFLS